MSGFFYSTLVLRDLLMLSSVSVVILIYIHRFVYLLSCIWTFTLLPVSAAMNRAAINIAVQMSFFSFDIHFFFLLGKYLREELEGHREGIWLAL